jgi:hypothetical protein
MSETARVVSEIPGRNIRVTEISPMPLDFVSRVTRLGFPVKYEQIWLGQQQVRVDSSNTTDELGITATDLNVTVTDMIKWIASTGRIKPKLIGKAV